jgi:hypothetical protein
VDYCSSFHPFVDFLLAIELSVLPRLTAFDNHFDIFKLFLPKTLLKVGAKQKI